jgi:hypothetical protein
MANSDDSFDAYSIRSFAKRHDISTRQVFKEIAAGRLEAFKVGSKNLITKEAGAAWRSSRPRSRAVPAVIEENVTA